MHEYFAVVRAKLNLITGLYDGFADFKSIEKGERNKIEQWKGKGKRGHDGNSNRDRDD